MDHAAAARKGWETRRRRESARKAWETRRREAELNGILGALEAGEYDDLPAVKAEAEYISDHGIPS